MNATEHQPGDARDVVFYESQPMWVNIIVRVVAPVSSSTVILMLVATGVQAPSKDRWFLLGIAGLVLMLDCALLFGLRLKTVVSGSDVRVRFVPLARLTIRRDQILAADQVTFDALSEFGGWGPKRSRKYGRVFTVAGERGVLLTLADGAMVLVGSQRSAELALALRPGAEPPPSGI